MEITPCPLTNEWISNVCACPYSHILFSFKKGILIHVTTCTNLEDIMPNEISQIQRANVVWSYLTEVSREVRVMETESRICVPMGWRRQQWGNAVWWVRSFSWGGSRVLDLDDGDGGPTMWIDFRPLNYTLKIAETVKYVLYAFYYI
jgi:hypothetical protein